MPELVLRIKGRVIRSIPVDKPEIIIGREPSADVFIDNSGISRWHAKIAMTGDGFEVMDNGSSNGTFVNGYQLKKAQPLKNGDEIQVGKFSLTYLANQGPSFVVTPNQRVPSADTGAVHNPEHTVHLNHNEISHLLETPSDRAPSAPHARVYSGSSRSVEPQSSGGNAVRILSVLLVLALLGIVALGIMLVLK